MTDPEYMDAAVHHPQRRWMAPDMTPDQVALAELMSDISEEAYAAGWMGGNEYSIWAYLQGGSGLYDSGDIPPMKESELRRLAERCGGWIVFVQGAGLRFVPMAQWLEMYAAHNIRGGD